VNRPTSGGRFGAAMTTLAAAGLAIATYLLAVRLLGEAPACGPIKGCETVAASEYATVAGVPVALFGMVYSLILAAGCLAWWRWATPRALYLVYALGLAGILAVAYLTYLEIFVIEAICIWCVTYGLTIGAGLILAATVALRGSAARA
jgi:uncharacterized membrane protein